MYKHEVGVFVTLPLFLEMQRSLNRLIGYLSLAARKRFAILSQTTNEETTVVETSECETWQPVDIHVKVEFLRV